MEKTKQDYPRDAIQSMIEDEARAYRARNGMQPHQLLTKEDWAQLYQEQLQYKMSLLESTRRRIRR